MATVIRHKETAQSRGFGFLFIAFDSAEESDKVKKQIIDFNKGPTGYVISGKRIDVKLSNDDLDYKTPITPL